ncbi:GGDEF domain-containing protein [Methylopila sp. Yamaguchi]|uniref:GGDEF domain-containing protein n=1 Tax=Methylopila sp. Yamaguchi TaxID=1437817 RepID=UPI000CB9FD55|nr:sensor domain-containing diguanylate cyclase [Methylopila sp. Yamaguchi]GBD47053.1 hypothetical protein METY_0266 [Methylopila sp. Yamaguchi]
MASLIQSNGAPQAPPPPLAGDEAARLATLARYDILDTPREEAFDRLTRLAKGIFRTCAASITLVDGHRQWFKSRIGFDAQETPRGPALCHATVLQGQPLVVHDAANDPRFADNPLVTGEPHLRFYAGAPLRTHDGHVLGALCIWDTKPQAFDEEQIRILDDLAKVVIDEMELRLLANADALTGALSRRAFRDEAERALHLAARHSHDLSLVAIDLDHFKTINDRFGHASGDLVLQRSVAACLGQLRTSDFIGRLGGEEFAVALPYAGPRAALEVAERLREAIGSETYAFGAAAVRMTASFGVASRLSGTLDVDALLSEADAALYMAKRQGRDRCVAARPVEPPAEARRRVFKGGRILFNRGASTIDCTVRTLSDRGAGVDVSSVAGLPDRFDLAIGADEVTHACRVVRLTDRHVEVEFA